MRDVVFLVADATMQQMLQGYFARPQFHRGLGCGEFQVDGRLNHDVFVAAGQSDSGLYARADELLRPHCATHHRAVVLLDADWDGSPGPTAIVNDVTTLVRRVWASDNVV